MLPFTTIDFMPVMIKAIVALLAVLAKLRRTSQEEMDINDHDEDEKPKSAFVDEADDDEQGDDLEALWEGDNEDDEDDEPVQRDDDSTADIGLEAIKKQTKFQDDSDQDELGDDEDGNLIAQPQQAPPPPGFEYTTSTKMQPPLQPSSTRITRFHSKIRIILPWPLYPTRL